MELEDAAHLNRKVGRIAAALFAVKLPSWVAGTVLLATGMADWCTTVDRFDHEGPVSVTLGFVLVGLAVMAGGFGAQPSSAVAANWLRAVEGTRWKTPAGETGAAVAINRLGTTLTLAFDGGESSETYPISSLTSCEAGFDTRLRRAVETAGLGKSKAFPLRYTALLVSVVAAVVGLHAFLPRVIFSGYPHTAILLVLWMLGMVGVYGSGGGRGTPGSVVDPDLLARCSRSRWAARDGRSGLVRSAFYTKGYGGGLRMPNVVLRLDDGAVVTYHYDMIEAA